MFAGVLECLRRAQGSDWVCVGSTRMASARFSVVERVPPCRGKTPDEDDVVGMMPKDFFEPVRTETLTA